MLTLLSTDCTFKVMYSVIILPGDYIGHVIIIFTSIPSALIQVIIPRKIVSSDPIMLQYVYKSQFLIIHKKEQSEGNIDDFEQAGKCNCGKSHHKGTKG